MNTMSASLSSRWIIDFEKQVFRGKHVLLYGNVHDQFLWRNSYLTAHDFIMQYFLEKRFELVVEYDPVDGFSFARPEMRRVFNEIVRQRVLAAHPGVSGADEPDPTALAAAGAEAAEVTAPAPEPADEEPENTDPTVPPRRQRPGETTPRRRVVRPIDPATAFAQLRLALSQGETSIVAVVNLGDMLTSDPARYAESERTALMILKKALLNASIIQQGPLAGYRNTMVITAGELKRVPEWLYLENPFVSIVQTARPARDERHQFIHTFLDGFYGAADIPAPDVEGICDEFADLTDGFQAWDLEALRRTSWVENLPIAKLRVLIDFFKFGIREDPWEELGREKVASAREFLSRRVIGQPYAVEAVCRMLTTARVGISMSGQVGHRAKPKGVFFFVGPTGVGKTELAKAVTELVFGDERSFARFDMSEYKEEHAAEKLAGAPPGFVGYEEGGQLTNRMLQHPHSILLFDEIEKAHPRVLDKFLQILEDGRLTDGKGQTAYFNQAAIIFTSNIGASELYERARHEEGDELSFEEVALFFREAVRDFFTNKIQRAEIYNRLGDNIVPFDLLRPDFVQAIGRKFLDSLDRNSLGKYEIDLEYDDSVLEYVKLEMTQHDNLLLGGRRIKTVLETNVEHPLNKWVFENFKNPAELRGGTLLLSMNRQGQLEVTRA